jgi:hypothetical protein
MRRREAGEAKAGAGERMTPLRTARLTLLASMATYGLGLAVGVAAPEAGYLIGLVASMSIALTALACVVIQLGELLTSRHRAVEKPE